MRNAQSRVNNGTAHIWGRGLTDREPCPGAWGRAGTLTVRQIAGRKSVWTERGAGTAGVVGPELFALQQSALPPQWQQGLDAPFMHADAGGSPANTSASEKTMAMTAFTRASSHG